MRVDKSNPISISRAQDFMPFLQTIETFYLFLHFLFIQVSVFEPSLTLEISNEDYYYVLLNLYPIHWTIQ